MDNVFTWAIVGAIAWYCFKHGKRHGSWKGYAAGRRRRRR